MTENEILLAAAYRIDTLNICMEKADVALHKMHPMVQKGAIEYILSGWNELVRQLMNVDVDFIPVLECIAWVHG